MEENPGGEFPMPVAVPGSLADGLRSPCSYGTKLANSLRLLSQVFAIQALDVPNQNIGSK